MRALEGVGGEGGECVHNDRQLLRSRRPHRAAQPGLAEPRGLGQRGGVRRHQGIVRSLEAGGTRPKQQSDPGAVQHDRGSACTLPESEPNQAADEPAVWVPVVHLHARDLPPAGVFGTERQPPYGDAPLVLRPQPREHQNIGHRKEQPHRHAARSLGAGRVAGDPFADRPSVAGGRAHGGRVLRDSPPRRVPAPRAHALLSLRQLPLRDYPRPP
mmetsp:Transcript_28782/g.91897  ORF Transcript_28782/g.91897 Transcript_28782/m.91897 type:complete len:214 (+) Transcript_28782:563-1204(+)